jgi:hypothetical protein
VESRKLRSPEARWASKTPLMEGEERREKWRGGERRVRRRGA